MPPNSISFRSSQRYCMDIEAHGGRIEVLRIRIDGKEVQLPSNVWRGVTQPWLNDAHFVSLERVGEIVVRQLESEAREVLPHDLPSHHSLL